MYRKLNLRKGDIIQEEHLAHIEQGIADATPMVNVTYAELVALRNEGKLIAGQKYRMTDYETTCTWENTQVAGHPFDLVLTALDNKTLDEKCSAIWSERDTDGYFANSNLPAWDVRYCLDNDISRFEWALKEGKYLIAEDGEELYVGALDDTIVLDGQSYYKWICTNGWAILCTLSETPSANEEIIVAEIGYEEEYWNCVALSTEDRNGGFGVIYRLIDESRNDVPYDFKNIMFSRPLTEGQYDSDNGVDTFCYTFCSIDCDTFEIADNSIVASRYCEENKFLLHCYNNVFLGACQNNTFGVVCEDNTFGDYCFYNTFGDYFLGNTFGHSCDSNTFGNSCMNNTFGNSCQNNTFGNSCQNNTFGNSCQSNTFGNACQNNTFGVVCEDNTFGNSCQNNTFGDYFSSNTLGNSCQNNTFKNNFGKNYHISSISGKEIQVDSRKYDTYITTDKNGNIVEYTVDNIINK